MDVVVFTLINLMTLLTPVTFTQLLYISIGYMSNRTESNMIETLG